MKLLHLLQQRRIWSAIIGFIVTAFSVLSIDLDLDVEFLEEAFANLFIAVSSLFSALLALFSYFNPKHDNK